MPETWRDQLRELRDEFRQASKESGGLYSLMARRSPTGPCGVALGDVIKAEVVKEGGETRHDASADPSAHLGEDATKTPVRCPFDSNPTKGSASTAWSPQVLARGDFDLDVLALAHVVMHLRLQRPVFLDLWVLDQWARPTAGASASLQLRRFFGDFSHYVLFTRLADTAERVMAAGTAPTQALRLLLGDVMIDGFGDWLDIVYGLACCHHTESPLALWLLHFGFASTGADDSRFSPTGTLSPAVEETRTANTYAAGVLGGSRPIDVFSASSFALDLILDATAAQVRLVVDVGRQVAVLDRNRYDLTETTTYALAALCKRPGNWVSSKQMSILAGARPDRALRPIRGNGKKESGTPLGDLIKAKTGTGYCLALQEGEVRVIGDQHDRIAATGP